MTAVSHNANSGPHVVALVAYARRAGQGEAGLSGTTIEPLAIDANADAQTLTVEWSDAHISVYTFEAIRWACPCASCRGEMGRPGVLDATEQLRPEQYDLEDINQVGRYAICPVWSDGHSTGIYTYAYLRRLCPCPVCAAERDAAR